MLIIIFMLITIILFNTLLGSIMNNYIDNSTKYEYEKITLKWFFVFLFFHMFCFLFLNKIRKIRKIEYYKNRIEIYKLLLSSGLLKINSSVTLSETYNHNDYMKILRYLKLNNIKNV